MQVARIKLNLETITKENLKKKAVTIKKLLEQIEKLLNIFDIKWNSKLNNTNRIRIGKQTYLNPQEDFINFVRNLRNMRGE